MTIVDGPDFICIGGVRSGTRWLFDQLENHPDFWMPPFKELHYFDVTPRKHRKTVRQLKRLTSRKEFVRLNDQRRARRHRQLRAGDRVFLQSLLALYGRPLDFAGYRGLFDAKGDLLSGDVTPTYAAALSLELRERIGANLPETKILYFARDPVAQFWSMFEMHVRKKRWNPGTDWENVSGYLALVSSHLRPSEIVTAWSRVITGTRLAWFLFDDLSGDSVNFRRRVLRFVGADPDKPSGDLPAGFNRKSDDPKIPMPDDVRDRLIAYFSEELTSCAREFGGAAVNWPERYGV